MLGCSSAAAIPPPSPPAATRVCPPPSPAQPSQPNPTNSKTDLYCQSARGIPDRSARLFRSDRGIAWCVLRNVDKFNFVTCWMFWTTKSISRVTFFPRVDMVTLTKYRSLTLRPLYDSYGFSARLKSKRYCCRVEGGRKEVRREIEPERAGPGQHQPTVNPPNTEIVSLFGLGLHRATR